MKITHEVDGVVVSATEAGLALKFLYKNRKSIKDEADLQIRFDDYIREIRSNGYAKAHDLKFGR